MKLRPTSIIFVCAISFFLSSKAQQHSSLTATQLQTNSNSHYKFNGQQVEGVSSDWYNEAISNVKRMEYDFYSTGSNDFKVANSKNRLSFSVSEKGYMAKNIRNSADEDSWSMKFEIHGIGRNKLKSLEPASSITNTNGMLVFHTGNINVEYLNNEEGLRQNFEIIQRPEGKGNLSIVLTAKGDAKGKMHKQGKIEFFDAEGNVKMIYEDLKAWDANKKPLDTRMDFDEKTQQISLVVNDANAVYPILIDPLNKTPEWSTSINGVISSVLSQTQLEAALYGYTVTGLGDVNGDGFGDAAVSAPALVDIFSGSGSLASVGAVFVFYGSPAGLSTTPNRTLQPTTAVAGALFGLSVDAGDVTGDGINDIIIGAPLDRISLNSGINAINGNVGKVYIYNGGTGSLSNTTPFLSIHLSSSQINSSNVSVNALFGFSVAVTEDLNGDGKKDIIVGSPTYAAIATLLNPLVQTGGAFVFLSGQGGNNFSTIRSLVPPTFSVLGISVPLVSSINGLLFGYSVDGVGDYNGDGLPDVVVGAPAGVNLSALTGVLTGQVLGGQALVYYGSGNANGINTSIGARLQANPTALLSNTANLFGFKVKGIKSITMIRNGSIAIGAPVGGLLPNTLGLTIQTGNVHVFKKKAGSPGGVVTADQVLESPKSTSLLQLLGTLDLNVLFGAAIDNAYDVNCDGYPDLVVGEPLSSGTNLLQLQANAVGGAAYVYLGNSSGGFDPTPFYDVSATHGGEFTSVNATALFGFSVAGVPRVKGAMSTPRIMVGAPSGALDFNNGLLNLGSTIRLLFSFTLGNNGLGKAYMFVLSNCMEESALPAYLTNFKGFKQENNVQLVWTALTEYNVSHYKIERSTDGRNYEAIGTVISKNISGSDYAFLDKTPAPGTNYYRLVTVDEDGKIKYSISIKITFATNTINEIVVMPNPVKNSSQILLTGLQKGTYHLQLKSASGQNYINKQIIIRDHQHQEPLYRATTMASGIYYLTVYDETNTIVKTVQVLFE